MKRVEDESDTDDPLCSSMELSSEEDEEEEEVEPLIAKDAILSLQSRLDAIYATFPPFDEAAPPSAMLLECVKKVCFFYFFVETDLDLQEPLATDSDHILRLKAYKIHYQKIGYVFDHKIETINTIVLKRVVELITQRNPKHPLLQVITQICENSEMHAIRCKNDPMYQRSDDPNAKVITNVPKLNIITDEQWSKDNKEHTHWRKLFFVLDSTAEEAEYDNLEHCERLGESFAPDTAKIRQNITYSIATKTYTEEDADFGYIFTEEYSQKMRLLHVMVHFPTYVNNAVINMIKKKSSEKKIEVGTWEQVWEQLMSPQYANAPISAYAKEQKKDLSRRGLSICNAIVQLWYSLLTIEKICNDAKRATQ